MKFSCFEGIVAEFSNLFRAAGVDIGAKEIFVAVPADRDAESVRSFEAATRDLHKLVDWLQKCRVRLVAMESTGVFWIPLYQILEARGFQAFLVNARHIRNVPGRKSDVSDCQWIQYLHSVGLLKASFRPLTRSAPSFEAPYTIQTRCRSIREGIARRLLPASCPEVKSTNRLRDTLSPLLRSPDLR